MPKTKTVVEQAVEQTLEEQELEKELAALDAAMDADAIKGLEDTPNQRFLTWLNEFYQWDDARAVNKTKTEVAKEAGDIEDAKRLVGEKPRIMKHLNIVLRHLVDAAAHEEVHTELANWITGDPGSRMRSNLRPLLAKYLLEKKDVDVSSIVARAQEIEDERRRLRKLST